MMNNINPQEIFQNVYIGPDFFKNRIIEDDKFGKIMTPIRFEQFTKVYTSNSLESNLENDINELDRYFINMFYLLDSEDYKTILKSVSPQFQQIKQLPKEWNPLLQVLSCFSNKRKVDDENNNGSVYFINDFETITWVSNCISNQNDYLVNRMAESNKTIQYGSLEIAKYAQETLFKNKNHYFGFTYLLNKAFKECNTLEISQILELSSSSINYSIINIKSFSPSQLIDIIQIFIDLNIFNNSNLFNLFASNIAQYFKSYQQQQQQQDEKSWINLNKIIGNLFDICPLSVINFLSQNILEGSEEICNFLNVQFIFNHFKLCNMYSLERRFKEFFEKQREYINVNPKVLLKERSNEQIQEIDSIINLLIEKIKNEKDNTGRSMIKIILNNLYSSLIQTKGISKETIINYYSLFKDNLITIDNSFFNLFYHLNLKSSHFSTYLINRGGLIISSDEIGFERNEWEENTFGGISQNYLSFPKNFQKDKYSFEVLFLENGGLSFDDLLERLISDLSHCKLNGTVNENYIDGLVENLNSDLSFCLCINRVDFFFKQMEFIQSLLDRNNFRIGNFPNYTNSNILSLELFRNTTTNNNQEKMNFEIKSFKYFPISDKVFDQILLTLNLQEIKTFLQFNQHYPNILSKLFEDRIIDYDIDRTELLEYLLNIYDQKIVYPILKQQLQKGRISIKNEKLFNNYINNNKNNSNSNNLRFEILKSVFTMTKHQELFNDFVATCNDDDNYKVEDCLSLVTNFLKDIFNCPQPEMKKPEIIQNPMYDEQLKTLSNLLRNEEILEMVNESFLNLDNEIISNIVTITVPTNLYKISQKEFSNLFKRNVFGWKFILSRISQNQQQPQQQQFELNHHYLTKSLIKNLIENGININIFKHIYINYNNIFRDNDELFHFLRNELSNHYDYKHIYWL